MAIEFRLTPQELLKIPLFESLNPYEAEVLLEIISTRVFSDKQVIFEQGTPGDALFVVLSGTVDIIKTLEDKDARTIAQFGAQHTFGEMTMIFGEVSERTASAVARGRCKLLIIYKDDFQKLITFGSLLAYKVALNISRLLSERLRQVDGALIRFYNESDEGTRAVLETFIERRKEILKDGEDS